MKKNKQDLSKVDQLEVEALTDEELELVEGGVTNITTVASCSCCVAGATNIGKPSINQS